MDKKERIGLGIITIMVLVAMLLALSFGSLAYRKYFEPKHKAIDREVWEETPSRVNGAVQEINKRYLEYQTASIEEQKAICSYLRTSYPDLTLEKINDVRLRSFFENCKYGG